MTTAEESPPATAIQGDLELVPGESRQAGGVGDVAGDLGTAVLNPEAPVHTGAGAQVNLAGSDYKVYVNSSGTKRRLRHWGVTEQQTRWLHRRFVEPWNYAEACAKLADVDGAVLLAGSSGAGKRATAQMLLCREASEERSITLVPVEPGQPQGSDEYRSFDGEDVSPGQRLLFDLSEADEVEFTEHQERLFVLLPAVIRHGALLVVILPPDHDGLRDDFAPLKVTISPPDPEEVLAAHLRAADRMEVSFDLSIYRRQLRPLTMAAIGQVAARADDIFKQTPGSDLAYCLSEALNGAAPREALVQRLLSDHQEAQPRVLLLSAALLEHAPVEEVFSAHCELLRILGFQAPAEVTAIELATVAQALAEIKAGCVLSPARRLSFGDVELGPTLLGYYWEQFPWLRADLAVWVRDLVISGSLELPDQKQVAIRFADQCIRSVQAHLVLDVAYLWAERGGYSARLAAHTVLVSLLTDERTGARARQRIYWWSRDSKLTPQVAAIIIALCVEVLAEQYFDQAVVRLAWLAQHQTRGIHRDARRALGELAKGSQAGRVFELLLASSRFDAATFRSVSFPQDPEAVLLLSADPQLRAQFTDGWHRVLDDLDTVGRRAALTTWLVLLADLLTDGDEEAADALLRQLMVVCSRKVDLKALFNACQDWSHEPSGELGIEQRIRTAQLVETEIRRVRRHQWSDSGEA